MLAVQTCVEALLGGVDTVVMYEVAPWSTVMWFSFFVLSMTFLLSNILIATIFDHYQIAKSAAGANTGFFQQLRCYIRDQTGRVRRAGCCQWLSGRGSMPSNDEMLEELMRGADFTRDERQLVRRNVLGPRLQRKRIDKLLFSGQAPADGLRLSEPANPDLVDMGCDADQVAALTEEAVRHSMRETQVEELEEAQMRELVARAEADIAQMKGRLHDCQSNVKMSMHLMAKQLQSAEILVHTALTELVLIAGPAGVPDKRLGKHAKNKLALTGAAFGSGMDTTSSKFKAAKHLKNAGEWKAQPGFTAHETQVGDWHQAVQNVRDHAAGQRLHAHK